MSGLVGSYPIRQASINPTQRVQHKRTVSYRILYVKPLFAAALDVTASVRGFFVVIILPVYYDKIYLYKL